MRWTLRVLCVAPTLFKNVIFLYQPHFEVLESYKMRQLSIIQHGYKPRTSLQEVLHDWADVYLDASLYYY